MTRLRISNRQARWLWLDANLLSRAPTGPLDLMAIIERLGFVQLDTIQVIARAHHHILWSRNQNYREPMLDRLMRRDRGVFEHFTHDASVLPMAFLPVWQRQFRRLTEEIERKKWYRTMLDADGHAEIKARITAEGPLSTHAFDTKLAGPKQMWARPPHKLALDYMWYSGELATSHRTNFVKFYDLGTRVFPGDLRSQSMSDDAQIDWLCRAALDRMNIATPGEIQRFWAAMTAKETRGWLEGVSDLVPVEVEAADKSWSTAFAPADIETRLEQVQTPTTRLRILNPFDPAIRDRARLERLFSFDYRIEMFVPAPQRRWGYYVYPLLEGDRFVGRLEAKADRRAGVLSVMNLWPEPGTRWTPARQGKLDAELTRLARFVGVERVEWQGDAAQA